MITRYATVVLTAVMLAVIAASGVSAVEPGRAEAATTYTVRTCTGSTIYLNPAEKRILDLHNQTRARYGLPLFCVNPHLTSAARSHSREMLDRDYFSHNSYNGESISARLRRFRYTPYGYRYWAVGENIAWGSGSYAGPGNRFTAWMNSPGHRANILNRDFREIGISVRTGTYTGYSGAAMYTVDFGTRRR